MLILKSCLSLECSTRPGWLQAGCMGRSQCLSEAQTQAGPSSQTPCGRHAGKDGQEPFIVGRHETSGMHIRSETE